MTETLFYHSKTKPRVTVCYTDDGSTIVMAAARCSIKDHKKFSRKKGREPLKIITYTGLTRRDKRYLILSLVKSVQELPKLVTKEEVKVD